MKWYIRITTELGSFLFWSTGYKTKREAERVAEMARKIEQNKKVTVYKR